MRKQRNIKQLYIITITIFTVLVLCSCKKNRPETVVASAVPKTVPTALTTEAPVLQKNIVAYTPFPLNTDAPIIGPFESPSHEIKKENKERYSVQEGVNSIAWITDTQHYANTFPSIYPTITTFLFDHRDDMHLAYVIHTGDLVHRNGNEENWKFAVEAMDLLKDIPCGVLAGNHDMSENGGGYSNYSNYFGESRYKDCPWYGDSFEDNRGHYDLLTIGDIDYIFVYMSFSPDENAFRFIEDSFNKYPDRVGILCVHDFITTDGTLSADGKILKERILKQCTNCYMVLCGHRYGLYCLQDDFDDNHDGKTDRTVYEMMMNYQAAGKEGGSGYFRIMQFDDNASEIRIFSYSDYLQDYNWLDDPSHNEPRYMMDVSSEDFSLPMPWRK